MKVSASTVSRASWIVGGAEAGCQLGVTIVSGTGGRYRSHRKLHFDGGRIRTRGRPTQRALLDEHFRIIGRKKLYYSIQAMQAEPDDCLVHADDGYGRPDLVFPNYRTVVFVHD